MFHFHFGTTLLCGWSVNVDPNTNWTCNCECVCVIISFNRFTRVILFKRQPIQVTPHENKALLALSALLRYRFILVLFVQLFFRNYQLALAWHIDIHASCRFTSWTVANKWVETLSFYASCLINIHILRSSSEWHGRVDKKLSRR